jgi:putative peptidoglycan lipid II flippase
MEVLARAFYALHDTRTPVMVGTAAMTLNVAFSFGFSALFRRIGWMPHGGLALANSLATALETTGLLILMRRRLGGIQGYRVFKGFGSALLGVAGMSLALWLWLALTEGHSTWWVSVGGILVGSAVYGFILILLRVPEPRQLIKAALKSFRIKIK